MIEQQTVVSETLKKAPPAPPSSPPRNRMCALISVALLTLAGVVVYALIHKNLRGAQITVDQMPTPNIRTATVRQGNIGQYIEAIGTVTPLATVNLYSQVNGQVVAVHYVEVRSCIAAIPSLTSTLDRTRRNCSKIRDSSNVIKRF